MNLIIPANLPSCTEIQSEGPALACANPAVCPLAVAQERAPGPEFCPLRSSGRCRPVADGPDATGVDWTHQPIGWIDL